MPIFVGAALCVITVGGCTSFGEESLPDGGGAGGGSTDASSPSDAGIATDSGTPMARATTWRSAPRPRGTAREVFGSASEASRSRTVRAFSRRRSLQARRVSRSASRWWGGWDKATLFVRFGVSFLVAGASANLSFDDVALTKQ